MNAKIKKPNKIIAETTDTVKVTSNTASSADVIVSALEQT